MKSEIPNPPAFPTPVGHAQITEYQPGHGDFTRTFEICTTGLSTRDFFAAKAMQSLIAITSGDRDFKERVAEGAYLVADAMLAERVKSKE